MVDLYCPKVGLTYCYVDVKNIKLVDLTSAILEKNDWNNGNYALHIVGFQELNFAQTKMKSDGPFQ